MTTTIKEILRKRNITINEDAPVTKAIELMMKEGTDHLIVLDRSGRVLGIVTANDILRTIGNAKSLSISIGQCCTYNGLITVKLNDDIYKAAALMNEYRTRYLLVVDDEGNPCGVLTLNDVTCPERLISRMAELTEPKVDECYGAD